MIFEEKSISSERIYEGKIINLKIDTIKLPDGSEALRELVEHPGGVGVIALTSDGKIPLVRQYRKPIEKAIWEIPAGKLDRNENIEVCGRRELIEETGYVAGEMIDLGFIYPSPGFVDEETYMFFTRVISKGECSPDEDEFVDVKEFTIAEVEKMIINNEVNDAKSVAAFLKSRALGLV